MSEASRVSSNSASSALRDLLMKARQERYQVQPDEISAAECDLNEWMIRNGDDLLDQLEKLNHVEQVADDWRCSNELVGMAFRRAFTTKARDERSQP